MLTKSYALRSTLGRRLHPNRRRQRWTSQSSSLLETAALGRAVMPRRRHDVSVLVTPNGASHGKRSVTSVEGSTPSSPRSRCRSRASCHTASRGCPPPGMRGSPRGARSHAAAQRPPSQARPPQRPTHRRRRAAGRIASPTRAGAIAAVARAREAPVLVPADEQVVPGKFVQNGPVRRSQRPIQDGGRNGLQMPDVHIHISPQR